MVTKHKLAKLQILSMFISHLIVFTFTVFATVATVIHNRRDGYSSYHNPILDFSRTRSLSIGGTGRVNALSRPNGASPLTLSALQAPSTAKLTHLTVKCDLGPAGAARRFASSLSTARAGSVRVCVRCHTDAPLTLRPHIRHSLHGSKATGTRVVTPYLQVTGLALRAVSLSTLAYPTRALSLGS